MESRNIFNSVAATTLRYESPQKQYSLTAAMSMDMDNLKA